MIIEIILILAIIVCEYKEHKSYKELCSLTLELAEINKLQSEENELLREMFSEQIRELEERVRADDVTSI